MAQFELFAAFIIGFLSSYGLLLFTARGKEFPPAVERDVFLSFAIGAALGVGTAVLRLAAVSSVATGAGANLSTTFLILSPMLATLDLSSLLIRAALGGDVGLSITFPSSARAYVRPMLFMTIFNFLIAFYQVDWNLWPMTAITLVLSLIYLQRIGVRLSKLRRKMRLLEKKHYA